MNLSVTHPTDRPNFTRVDIDELTVWYSYRTPIAFHVSGHAPVVRENDWSNTTGKHLNYIDDGDKAARIPGDEFERLLRELTITVGGIGELIGQAP